LKRQKRDRNQRAYDRGYAAGIKGKSKNICPHADEATRGEWLGGWRQAKDDAWNADVMERH